jgi:hypothetical protein
MKTCILCGVETTGSVGKAGIRWARICQPCKDAEDEALENRLVNTAIIYDKLLAGLGVAGVK